MARQSYDKASNLMIDSYKQYKQFLQIAWPHLSNFGQKAIQHEIAQDLECVLIRYGEMFKDEYVFARDGKEIYFHFSSTWSVKDFKYVPSFVSIEVIKIGEHDIHRDEGICCEVSELSELFNMVLNTSPNDYPFKELVRWAWDHPGKLMWSWFIC